MTTTAGQLLPDSIAPQANEAPQVFYEQGTSTGKVGPGDSQKVGWTLRDGDGNIIPDRAFAFKINPQGLTRGYAGRNQMHATKGGFYVDDFGVGPTTITLRQLVASGKTVELGDDFTARGDVVRFLQTIYYPATKRSANGERLKVYFHDNHLDRGFEEQVYFPAQAVAIQRSVDLHNVWLVEITMMSLEKTSTGRLTAERDPRVGKTRLIRVKRGDTFHKIAYRLLGKKASKSKAERLVNILKKLNPTALKKRDIKVGGTTIHAKAGQLVAGEPFRIPA